MRLLVYELRPLALESEELVDALEQRVETVELWARVQARISVQGEIELPQKSKKSSIAAPRKH